METNKQKLELEKMDKVSGGSIFGKNIRYLDSNTQQCAREGYCPACNPKMQGSPWRGFSPTSSGYMCDICSTLWE